MENFSVSLKNIISHNNSEMQNKNLIRFFKFFHFNQEKLKSFTKDNTGKIKNLLKISLETNLNRKTEKKVRKANKEIKKSNLNNSTLNRIGRLAWELIKRGILKNYNYNKKIRIKTQETSQQKSNKIVKVDNTVSRPLPYAIGVLKTNTKNNKLQHMLLDTGAQASLISTKHLKDLEINEDKIEPCSQYNIQSSTTTETNCVLGRLKTKLYLKRIDGGNFIETSEFSFLVVNDQIPLPKIILGANFFHENLVTMMYNREILECEITGLNENKRHKTRESILITDMTKVKNISVEFKNINKIHSGNTDALFTSKRHVLENVTLINKSKLNEGTVPDRIELCVIPEIIWKSSGYPKITDGSKNFRIRINTSETYNKQQLKLHYQTENEVTKSIETNLINLDETKQIYDRPEFSAFPSELLTTFNINNQKENKRNGPE